MVPQTQAAPPPPPPPGTRISRPQAQTHSSAPPSAPQTRFVPRPAGAQKAADKKQGLIKALKILAVVLVLGVGGYFGFGYLSQWQDKANAKRHDIEKNSDGGEVGHTMELYNVLDATEPGGRGLGSLNRRQSGGPPPRPGSAPNSIAVPSFQNGAPASASPGGPVVAPVWTLDPGASAIPDSRVNGRISGAQFVMDTSRVDPVGTAQVLRLMQGSAAAPDREVLIYLHPKAGTALASQSWTVAKDMSGSGVPNVIKRWKASPAAAPQLKSFLNGYALKLEFGQATNDTIPGKIFLALPDAEHTVIGGSFETTVSQPSPTAAAPAPAAIAPTPQSPAGNQEFDKRYGTKKRS
jgi:hypothetical protein